ncbi:Phospholipase C [Thelotrema lepadinum]|nr:Phospholipase C [Thelotrema lepadinum]
MNGSLNIQQTAPSGNLQSPMRHHANGDASKYRSLTLPSGSAPKLSSGQAASFNTSPSSTSLRSSPDIFQGQDGLHSGCVSPLQLPATATLVSPLPSGQSAMSEVVKSPGLIRRLSGRAASRLVRSRQSSSNIRSRDQSSGPLVTRRRSVSKTSYDSDKAANDGYSTVDDYEFSPLDAKSMVIPNTTASTKSVSRKPSKVEDYQPPIIHDDLRRGTRLDKVTRKKTTKPITLVLDPQAAKVTWNSRSKSLYIDDIQAIRVKGDAKKTRDDLSISQEFENRWVTIVYADDHRRKGRPTKELNLIFPPADESLFERWTSTLVKLYRYRHDLIVGLAGPGLDESTLRSRWNVEMEKVFQGQSRAATQERLDFNGVERVCRSLNINWSTEAIQSKFAKADLDSSKTLDYEQFRAFVKDVKVRSDVLARFRRIHKQDENGLTLAEFLTFLQGSQGVSVAANPSYWESVFSRFVHDDQHASSTNFPVTKPIMRFSAFNAFLSSAHNNILRLGVVQEKLDRPLNEYFIYSSHNTYLLGRQVFGSSSVEGYIRVLQQGCRCVEIDCWPGGSDFNNQPVVTHGRTKSSKIYFEDCISAISRYAFEASEYPLILSLEVHCRAQQQEIMVSIMQKVFGDKLVQDLLDPHSGKLPSPEQLRGKILIKAKTGAPAESESSISAPIHTRQRSISSPAAQQHVAGSFSFQLDASLPSPASMSPLFGSSSPSTPSMVHTPRLSTSSDDSDPEVLPAIKAQRAKKAQSKLVDSLDRLCVYTRGLKFRDFHSDTTKTYNHIYSLAEGKFEKLCRDKEKSPLLEQHNIDCLMRVYPSQMRYMSSNFDPLQCWKKGVQMAALNCQTYDAAMQMNEAMFASDSDRSGYVLKPRNLRPVAGPTAEYRKRIDLSISVVSAQFLPRPRGQDTRVPSPYIEVQVYIPDDKNTRSIEGKGGFEVQMRDKSGPCQSHRRRTVIVPNNGYDPLFNNQFTFEITTKHPELVFVRWSVWNSNDASSFNNNETAVPEATFTAKLSSLQDGLRHLPLRNHLGEQFSFSTIFCKIEKGEAQELHCEERLSTEREERKGFLMKTREAIGFGTSKRSAPAEKRKNSNAPDTT